MRALQIVVRRPAIGLRLFPIPVRAFEVGLRALQIRLRTLAFGMRAFEIRLDSSALGGHRFLEFTTRLCGRLGRGLFGLASRAGHGFIQRAFHFTTRGGHFGFEPRSPLGV